MKKLVCLFIFTAIVTSTVSAENSIIKVKDVSDDKVIKSINSDLCHMPTSKYRGQLTIKKDKSNVYDSLEKCLSEGGKLSKTQSEKLAKGDPEISEELKTAQKVAEKKAEKNTKFYGINWGLGTVNLT